MRLAWKLILAVVLLVFAALAANTWLAVRREVLHFEADMRRDHHLLGRLFLSAVARVSQSDGPARARELIERANRAEDAVRLRWVEPAAMSLSAEAREQLLRGEEVMVVKREAGEGMLVTLEPLPQGAGAPAALELAESFALEESYARDAFTHAAATSAAVALLSALLTAVLGVLLIGRPMRALIEKARRVGEGDLLGPLELTQRDEIAELAREMNAMCAQLLRAKERIAAETAARINALEQLRHADRLSTVGKLASGVAHELGTPLNVVSGRARMIQTGEASGDEARDCARIVVQQSEAMTRIIRQLLDFARRRHPQKAPEDLTGLARQTLNLLAPMAQKKRLHVEFVGEGGEARAAVDAGQLQQALTNLVVNAIQATSEGGALEVGLARETVQPPPDVGGAEARCLRLYVKDTGAGIPREQLDHIFEPFFTTKEVGEGTGLGLSVAWGIVREHGGWIGVSSQPGQGSCFSIYLPQRA